MILDGLPGLYGLKYDSATACGLPLYLCSYKLVGSATAHHGVTRSHVTAALAVKPATVIASMIYDDVQPRVREVGEALVVVGHQRARPRRHTTSMVATVEQQCGLTCACPVALAAQGGGVDHGGATCKVD